MKCLVIRTAMCGGGLSYDIYVPEPQCPEYVLKACPGGSYYTRIDHGSQTYLDFDHATMSKEHCDMEQGYDRYAAWLDHEKACKGRKLAIAQRVFPELAKVQEWPFLWLNNLGIEETSEEKWVTV